MFQIVYYNIIRLLETIYTSLIFLKIKDASILLCTTAKNFLVKGATSTILH